MTQDQSFNQDPSHQDPSQKGLSHADKLSVASLLRCAADGELNAEQEAQLCSYLDESPGCTQRIEFEQRLRAACCDCFSGQQTCPDELRRSVEKMLGSAGSSEISRAHPATDPERLAPMTRKPSFWNGGAVARGVAMAAVLVLAVTLAFQVGQRSGMLGGSGSQVLLAARATEFVEREHLKCELLTNPDVAAKFTATTPEELPQAFEAVMGRTVSLDDIIAHADSIQFVDAGKCGVPGAGKSLHIRMSTLDQGAPHTASLFVQEDRGGLQLEEGKSYHVAGGDGMDKPCVFVWKNNGMLFWLVCDRDDAQQVRQAVGAPALSDGSI